MFGHERWGCQQVDHGGVQSADDRWKSRAAALEWKWRSPDNVATRRFKSPQFRGHGQERVCRLGWRADGVLVVVVRLVYSPKLWSSGFWQCLDIRRGPRRARACRAKFSRVTASAASYCLCTVSFGEWWKPVPACTRISGFVPLLWRPPTRQTANKVWKWKHWDWRQKPLVLQTHKHLLHHYHNGSNSLILSSDIN